MFRFGNDTDIVFLRLPTNFCVWNYQIKYTFYNLQRQYTIKTVKTIVLILLRRRWTNVMNRCRNSFELLLNMLWFWYRYKIGFFIAELWYIFDITNLVLTSNFDNHSIRYHWIFQSFVLLYYICGRRFLQAFT